MKKIKIKDSDYLYAGARIRALENGIVGAERLSLMAHAKDETDLERMEKLYQSKLKTLLPQITRKLKAYLAQLMKTIMLIA